MKRRFHLTFCSLYFLIGAFALFYMPLPMSGGGPLPAWVIEQENRKIRIFEALVLPGSWAGGADLFIGPATWALLLSVPIVWVLRPHATKARKLQV